MSDFVFDNLAYLKRIKLDIEVSATAECMIAIHNAQHRVIPFENFDIALGKEISLEPAIIFNKLVHNKRGGYCHELNSLLRMALQYYGFDVRPLLGRVHVAGVTARGHNITLVNIQGQQWFIDAGFGLDTPPPMPLIFDKEVEYNNQLFKLVEHDLYGAILKTKHDDDWIDLYSFDLTHVLDVDIECANHCSSTSPKSVFVFARVAVLPTDEGVISLFNTTLKIRTKNNIQEIELQEDDTYIEALKKYFGIELNARYTDLIPIVKNSTT